MKKTNHIEKNTYLCNSNALIRYARTKDNHKTCKETATSRQHLCALQPQALDVERAVLGALLIDKDAYSVICEMLFPESFYDPRHQMIYTAIRDLSMAEKPVDVLTVTEQMAKNGNLEDAGGPGYIAEISSRVASSAHVDYHARIVAQKFLARQLIQFAGDIETKAFDETIDVDDLMQHAEGALFELSQKNMKKDYTQIDPVVGQAMQAIQKAAGNSDGLTGVPTGYHKLDEMTSGWQARAASAIRGRTASTGRPERIIARGVF